MNREQLKQYFTKDLRWGTGHQTDLVFDFLCKAAEAARGGVVLDAGSGYQRYKPFFHESFYVAQDHPVAGVQNKKILEYDILCDVRVIPLQDNCVDVVLSTSSLEHMEFPDEFFHEAFRVLKPSGHLFIHVPFIYGEHEVPYDFQRPTRYGLDRWYRSHGFEQVKISPSCSSVHTGAWLFVTSIKEDGRRFGRSIGAKLIWKPLLLAAKALGGLACALLDKGACDQTTMPVGWISWGRKPGEKQPPVRFNSKQEWITQHVQVRAGDGLVLKEGIIAPE